MNLIIDTHCHISDTSFDLDRNTVLNNCFDKGIHKIVMPAVSVDTWDALLKLSKQYQQLYPTLGLHPIFIKEHQYTHLAKLEELLENTNVIAIGEIGLDFYLKDLDKEKQIEFFEAQLVIAKNHKLPVVLHVRKAHDQVLQLLHKYKIKGGFCHAFNGSIQQAKQYIDLNFKLGFGGTLTYDNSKKIHKLAKELPIESIVLETDAPDMVVESHRGERNSPEYIVDVLSALAQIRNDSIETIAAQTTKNANEIMNFTHYDQQ